MNTRASDATPWYRQRWPWLLIAGPATVVVAGAVTVWLAVSAALCLVVAGIPILYQGQALSSLRAEQAQAQAALTQQAQTLDGLGTEQDRLDREINARDPVSDGPANAAPTNRVTAIPPPSPAKLYGWSEDSPVVRVPKYLLQFADIRLDSVLTNYQLTDIAIDVLDLNETEAQQANQLLTEAFTTYDAVEASHTRPVTQPLSDLPLLDEAKLNLPAGEKRSFLTTLPPEVRTDLKARLHQGLETSVGEARAVLVPTVFGHSTAPTRLTAPACFRRASAAITSSSLTPRIAAMSAYGVGVRGKSCWN